MAPCHSIYNDRFTGPPLHRVAVIVHPIACHNGNTSIQQSPAFRIWQPEVSGRKVVTVSSFTKALNWTREFVNSETVKIMGIQYGDSSWNTKVFLLGVFFGKKNELSASMFSTVCFCGGVKPPRNLVQLFPIFWWKARLNPGRRWWISFLEALQITYYKK